MTTKFKWTVEIEIDEVWVADGFEITRGKMLDMLRHALPFAYDDGEYDAKIIHAPTKKSIKECQGA